MQPDQPTPQPGQYDFFMNTPAPKKQPLFGGAGGGSNGSKSKRLLIVVGGGGLLLIVLIMFLSLLSGGNKRGDLLLGLAQQQAELIRVTDLAKAEPAARSTATQLLAVNTGVSIKSSHVETLALLKTAGVKSAEKKLGLKQNPKTDERLTAAAQDNTYDQVFEEIVKTQLEAYQSTAKTLYQSATSQNEKQLLDEAYTGAALLLGQQEE